MTMIEERLRRHFDERTAHLPTTGPGLDARADNIVELTMAGSTPRRGPWLAAASIILIVGGLVVFTNRGPGPDEATSSTSNTGDPADAADVLQPTVTLPDSADVDDAPVTVAGTAPSSWFRIAPDLDIAWFTPRDGSGVSMICLRTPTTNDCQADTGRMLVAPTAGGQTLVVGSGADSKNVQIQLDDGTALSAPVVTYQSVLELGVARFELPPGTSIVSVQGGDAGDDMTGEPEAVAVTGATLPPAADLSDIPVTIMAGSQLSYWRFLPDLDISERETDVGSGTELCWRTPAGTGCIDDAFNSPDVGVIPADGAAIFLVRPALTTIEPPPSDPMAPTLQIGPNPTTITVTFSDGTTTEIDVTQGEQFGVGYARVDVAADNPIVSATSG